MEWTPEAEAALQDLKKYLSSAPTVVANRPQEPLLLYLAATNQVVSAALVAQRQVDDEVMAATEPDTTNAETTLPVEVTPKKKMMQHPVYFVSSLLQGGRSRYSGMQKLLFGLLMASRKLHHYFQAHEIAVVTRLPLQQILHNPDATGRIIEWALELSSFGLNLRVP